MESINEKQFEVAEIKISYEPKVKPSDRPLDCRGTQLPRENTAAQFWISENRYFPSPGHQDRPEFISRSGGLPRARICSRWHPQQELIRVNPAFSQHHQNEALRNHLGRKLPHEILQHRRQRPHHHRLPPPRHCGLFAEKLNRPSKKRDMLDRKCLSVQSSK